MFESELYDPRREKLERGGAAGSLARFSHTAIALLGLETEGDYQPPATIKPDQALEIARQLPIERTFDPGSADGVIEMPYLPSREITNSPWDNVSTADITKRITASGAEGLFRKQAKLAQVERAKRIVDAQWWTDFDSGEYNVRNPFHRRPTEQFIITIPDNDEGNPNNSDVEKWEGGSVNIYNFGAKLDEEIQLGFIKAVGLYAQITRGDSLRVVPNIVIHNDFKPMRFPRSGSLEVPSGLSRIHRPYIEIDAGSLEDELTTEQNILHELTHQFHDTYGFKEHFLYVDENKDGFIDYSTPRCAQFCTSSGHVCQVKVIPHRDYALTSPMEHQAVTAELAVMGSREVDQFARDALLWTLYAELGKPIVTDLNPGKWEFEHRTGEEITMPQIDQELLVSPIKLLFTDRKARAVKISQALQNSRYSATLVQ